MTSFIWIILFKIQPYFSNNKKILLYNSLLGEKSRASRKGNVEVNRLCGTFFWVFEDLPSISELQSRNSNPPLRRQVRDTQSTRSFYFAQQSVYFSPPALKCAVNLTAFLPVFTSSLAWQPHNQAVSETEFHQRESHPSFGKPRW